jgi:hypothetical protein
MEPIRTGLREVALLAFVAMGSLLVLIVEGLSIPGWIGPRALWGAWSLALVALVSAGRCIRIERPAKPTWIELAFVGGISGIVLAVLIVGLVAAPNNWDSMTYHLARTIHWMQNGSIVFYPASIIRQLYSNPWAEYAILNLQLLTGSDRFDALVQWLSMFGSIVGVSLIAKELGAERRGQILAAVFCATLPVGILEASSTQTDYADSLWVVCFVYFGLRFIARPVALYTAATGAALGLALLAKATAYIYAFPFLVWFALSSPTPRKIKLAAFGMALALLLNLGHYARVYDLYGSPVPIRPDVDPEESTHQNEVVSVPALLSNLIRNAALHASTSSPALNQYIEKAIYKAHGILGISPNDPRTTWKRAEFHVVGVNFHEDNTGNPFHLALIAVGLLFMLRKPGTVRLWYGAAWIAAILLFVVYLKWQPWHSRLHLPLFVLFAPLLGCLFSRCWTYPLAALLIIAAIPWVFYNQSRPIFGERSIFKTDRTEQYFANRPELLPVYRAAAVRIVGQGCADVGLLIYPDAWEYPLWVLMRQEIKGVRFENVLVENDSRKYDSGTFVPCGVFFNLLTPPAALTIRGTAYRLEWTSTPINVFEGIGYGVSVYFPEKKGLSSRRDP